MDFDHSLDTISPDLQNVLTIGGTGGLVLPTGTAAQEPSSPVTGTIRWNTDVGQLESFDGTVWAQYIPGAGSGSSGLSTGQVLAIARGYAFT